MDRLAAGPTDSSHAANPTDVGAFPLSAPLRLLLDRVDEGVMICDANAHPRVCNPSMSCALDDSPRGERLRREVEAFVEELHLYGPELRQKVVHTREGGYLLEGGTLRGGNGLNAPGYLVILRHGVTVPLEASQLQERFHLTEQETRVLNLLTDGCSNREISHTLGVSEHTTRHHVEHILLKLGVRSRAAAVARVLCNNHIGH